MYVYIYISIYVCIYIYISIYVCIYTQCIYIYTVYHENDDDQPSSRSTS